MTSWFFKRLTLQRYKKNLFPQNIRTKKVKRIGTTKVVSGKMCTFAHKTKKTIAYDN